VLFWIPRLLTIVIFILNLLLILIVLIQRGKGGGLAGAFGGAGGSSAFGSRAGDLFTKITIGLGAFWIVLTMLDVVLVQRAARESQVQSSTFNPD
jgi:preprotein translocase subunit SecG